MSPLKGWFGIALNLILAVLALAGAAICIFFFRETSGALEIRDASSGTLYKSWPLKEGGEFSIEFVHSVNQSPVRETFRNEGKEIRVAAVRFFSFGAGMLSDLEEGRQMSREGDALVITGFNQTVRKLNYIVGTVSDHVLYINGETVSLRALCGRNAHIIIQIK